MEKYLEIINKFIEKMGYRNNEHYLGVYFYGSCLTGFNTEDSDIDLHIIFDDSDKAHIYRGVSYIEGMKIEYFEKCISDLYLSVKNDIKEMNGSWYSMIGISKIIEDKNNKLLELKKYTLDVYSKGLPKMDNQDIMEKISIIDNRMKRLKKLSLDNSPNLYSLYYITIEKIRRFYHSIHGLPKINTSKIYKVYKCDEYRKSYFPGKFVSNEFKKLYFDLIETEERDKKILFKKIEKFYTYVKDGRKLGKEFRLKIKSRNE